MIHTFCTSDMYSTLVPIVKKMSTNKIRANDNYWYTHETQHWQVKNTYHHQLEIHIMVLTCFIPLPAQTETHMKSTLSQRVLVVCVYIASLLSLSSWHGLFLDRLFEDRRRGGINTRDLMYVKFCWSFYLNCPLDRENSLYKAFKRRTKDI